jgi:hypothetical protein
MTKANSQVAEAIPAQAADFKLIHGIGPGIERRFHAAGILTYSQLASMTPEKVLAALGDVIGLTLNRVVEQDWINQARSLAAEEQSEIYNNPIDRQHYASFMVELLLDMENHVRRTRIVNIQTKTEDTWASWEGARLLDFIVSESGLRFSETESGKTKAEIDMTETGQPKSIQPVLAGKPRVEEFIVVANVENSPQHFLIVNQPFGISITLDLSTLSSPQDTTLEHATTVIAKKLGSGERHQVGEANGSFLPVDKLHIRLNDLNLASGTYRLEAAVNIGISPLEDSDSKFTRSLFTEGNLVQVY